MYCIRLCSTTITAEKAATLKSNGYNLIYFVPSQGSSAADSAISATNTLGFPDGTIIYFAVDFDALDIDVINAIIPYFEAIKNTFTELGSNYKIGIYTPRNVCNRIANVGYSCSSFVCDMSSGFSIYSTIGLGI